VTMDTLIGHPMEGVLDRFEDLPAGVRANVSRSLRLSGLTSRDIEAEALVRLARGGYDWPATPKENEGGHHVWPCEGRSHRPA
jgi:hypothetical protein